MKMDKLEQLWSIAEIEAKRRGIQFPYVFDPIGLNLIRPLKQELYESTPKNSMSFATTGGDGVHFSFVQLNGEIVDHSPIVMTVPMNFGSENLIVGADFEDFLCLGCEVGFFFLEQLTYSDSKADALYWLSHPEEWFTNLIGDLNNIDINKNLLKLLRTEFDLRPWDNIEKKLLSLEDEYLPLLELSSDNM
jgi:hypothetical protein